MKIVFSAMILLFGAAAGWYYLRPHKRSLEGQLNPLAGHRPWRRIGAGICLVLSVMFVVGIYAVDIPDHPRPYAAYWLIMLGLVVWLCVLAIKDIRYTRELLIRWRAQQDRDAREPEADKEGSSSSTDSDT